VTGDRDIVAVLVDIDGTLIITGGARATNPARRTRQTETTIPL
jgi:hypothetical protein